MPRDLRDEIYPAVKFMMFSLLQTLRIAFISSSVGDRLCVPDGVSWITQSVALRRDFVKHNPFHLLER